MTFSTKKWLDAARAQMQKCGWRLSMTVSLSFVLLTIFFCVYDRSYLDSAMTMLDSQFTPLHPSSQKVDDGATTAAGIIIPPLTSSQTSSSSSSVGLSNPPPLFPGCNIYDGQWVYDESYPLYTDCSFAEMDFQCHRNGRPDHHYQKWRWQPYECTLPRFDAKDILARLDGLRVVFVGDSMGRTQWESLNCLLLQGVSNKASVTFVHGPITKQSPYIGTTFRDHNVSIDYYRSPHIVAQGGDVPHNAPNRVLSTLRLQKIDKELAKNFANADVLLLNSGHWWTSQKTYDVGLYFQVDNKVVLGLPVIAAFKQAMSTITSWVSKHINFNRTEVFFRSIEPAHWELNMADQPYSKIFDPQDYPRAAILKEAVDTMQAPAMILNVTSLSAFRPDGHVFNWTTHRIMDCSHWCLPGVPDTWNELLYASLLLRGRGVWGSRNGTESYRK
ncbi:unnamed protein product [Calypogeia fissa]